MGDKVKSTLTIPTDLNDWLKEQAKSYGRSKNEHINFLLQSFRDIAEYNKKTVKQIMVKDEVIKMGSEAVAKESKKKGGCCNDTNI